MPTFSFDSDIVLSVARSSGHGPLTGYLSDFATQAHLGTEATVRGWEWDVRTWPGPEERDVDLTIPFLADASTSGVPDRLFQSGIGSDRDLEVLDILRVPVSGLNLFAPEILHGHYFTYRDEHYLFADGSRQEFLVAGNTVSEVVSGFNIIQLSEVPKAGVPITVRQYSFDEEELAHDIELELTKVIDFTGLRDPVTLARVSTQDSVTDEILYEDVDTVLREFVMDSENYDPPALILGGIYTEEVGIRAITEGEQAQLDQLGEANGQDEQELHTTWSPIDRTQPAHIYVYQDLDGPFTEWEVTEGTPGPEQAQIDYDLGTIRFGTAASGSLPTAGYLVGAHYTKTMVAEYEPQDTTDSVIATESSADTNPIRHSSGRGFIFLSRAQREPASIELYAADLPEISEDLFGPLNIGAGYTALKAIVRDSRGQRLEGIRVAFDITDSVPVGSLSGGETRVYGITNEDGIATAYYNPPLTINEVGFFTDSVVVGPPASLTVEGSLPGLSVSGTYIYKVFRDDPILGMSFTTVAEQVAYWTSFFSEEGIFGPTGFSDPALAGDIDQLWELRHRILLNLLTPAAYNRSLRNGRKQIVSVWDAGAVHPRTGVIGAFAPLQPSSVSTTATTTVYTFADNALDPLDMDLDGYFVVAPRTVSFQATTYSLRRGQTITSNEISIGLAIPGNLSGTVLIDDINDIPVGLVSWALTAAHEGRRLPLGFRLRSSGATLGGALNGVTYLDINRPDTLGLGVTVTRGYVT